MTSQLAIFWASSLWFFRPRAQHNCAVCKIMGYCTVRRCHSLFKLQRGGFYFAERTTPSHSVFQGARVVS